MKALIILLRLFGTFVALLLLILAAAFLLAGSDSATGSAMVLGVGAVLGLAGLLLIVLSWWPYGGSKGTRGGERAVASTQEAPGELSLKQAKCPQCGGYVDPSSAKLGPEGTLSVTCDFCQAVFMVQEEPKW